jgi:hypothetical protein
MVRENRRFSFDGNMAYRCAFAIWTSNVSARYDWCYFALWDIDVTEKDIGQMLRDVIEAAGITQLAALERFNRGQARPLSVSQWKAYLANPDSARRSPCPDSVLKRAKRIFSHLV